MFKIIKKPLGSQRLSFYEDEKIQLSAKLTKAGVSIECDGVDSSLSVGSKVSFLGDALVIVDLCPLGMFSLGRLTFPAGEWIYIGLNFSCDKTLVDSPVICGRGGEIYSYLSYGQSFSLKMSSMGREAVDLEKHCFANETISSLASYVSSRYPNSDLGFKISMGRTEKWKAAFLCLLRKSNPHSYMELDDLPEAKPCRSYWLRLMQNIGVVCAKAPRKKHIKLIELNIEEFVILSPLLESEELISFLSGPSSIIPHKILK